MRICLSIVASLAIAAASPSASARPRGPEPRFPSPVPCPSCWVPAVNTTWQWQLSGTLDTSVDVQVYDIDMFETSKAQVGGLHTDGRTVICYISAGSWERYRPDASSFPRSVIGDKLDGWPGERWLDIRKRRVLRPIIQARVDLCVQKGFDGVEFDNVDAWSNHSGFPITRTDQLRYNVMLANMAHRAGLAVALKNDVEQVKDLLPYFDMELDEQCFQYKECDRLVPFVDAGKPVFEVEYRLDTSQFCPQANALDLNAMRKKLALGPWREPCR